MDHPLTDYEEGEIATFFQFLDDLRETGATNMFGAAPYVEERFEVPRRLARLIVTGWMQTFGDGSAPPAQRARDFLAAAA